MAKRISIINFKGGVGKTTLAFHLGTFLAWAGEARVLMIDMDHQSSLSVLCLGDREWQNAVDAGHTVNEIFETFTDQSLVMPDDEIIIRSPMQRIDPVYDRMDIVPASLELDDTEIELTATHHPNPLRSEWNKRTLICRWLEEAGIDDQYDFIIFDCPPATKIVTQNAIAASHGYIVPVVPEAVMARGVPHLREMMRTGIDARLNALASMGEHRMMFVPNTELIGLVVTRIRTHASRSGYTNSHTQHLRSLERNWRDLLITPYIEEGVGVEESLTDGVPVYNRTETQNVGGRELEQLFYELLDNIIGRINAL